jgi:hypothetical protein
MRHRPRGKGNLREVVLELASLISLTTLCPEFQKLNFTPRTSFTRCAQILLLSRSVKEQTPAEMSFSSLEEQKETDDADWWKTLS